MKNSGIYKIEHKSGKFYIGSAVSMDKRWGCHRRDLSNQTHRNKKLQRAWNKYGESEFAFSVIEVVDDKANLIEREQYWIDILDAVGRGYNISPTAGSVLGMRHTPEAILKSSAALKGRVITPEWRAKLSVARKGKKHTEEARKKMRAAAAGKTLTEDHKKKISAATRGRVFSDETRAKMSEAQKTRPPTSDEARRKMSEARSAYWKKKKELQTK